MKDDEIRARHAAAPLVDGELALREGLIVRVALSGAHDEIVGYRAIKNGDVIDVDRPRRLRRRRFLGADPRARRQTAHSRSR